MASTTSDISRLASRTDFQNGAHSPSPTPAPRSGGPPSSDNSLLPADSDTTPNTQYQAQDSSNPAAAHMHKNDETNTKIEKHTLAKTHTETSVVEHISTIILAK